MAAGHSGMTLKPIFLSASKPDPKREEYRDSYTLVRLREAIRATLAFVLPRQPLVFGGHPAISPLVRAFADRIRHDLGRSPSVLIYQSNHFARLFTEDAKSFSDIEITPAVDADGSTVPADGGDRRMSLALMRYAMIGHPDAAPQAPQLVRYQKEFGAARGRRFDTLEFGAAVFIGGMEGVECEFDIFRRYHPTTPAWPIVSTGAACEKLADKVKLPSAIMQGLRDDTVYNQLIPRLLSGGVDAPKWLPPDKPGNELDPSRSDEPQRR
jgi:hypothetical protein